MTLHLTAQRLFFICLAIWFVAGCSESLTENDDEPGAPPEVIILDGPQELTHDTEAHFSFECVDDQICSFFCRLDDGPSEPCESPTSFADLDDGEHLFEVFAVDDFDQESEPVQWSWTVDSETPVIVDLIGPPALTNETDATFDFHCSKEDCIFSCQLNGATPESCAPGVTYEDLDDGEHHLAITATDGLGTTGPPTEWTWNVDTTAPSVIDLTGPDDPTNETDATFDFHCSKEDCQFSCSLSDAEGDTIESTTDCESGKTYSELADDDYTFAVTATDPAGNISAPETYTWSVDTEPPVIQITDAPPADVAVDWAEIEFECSNKPSCSFECALDYEDESGAVEQGGWESCTSPHLVDELEAGGYTLHLQATDEAGNQATKSVEWMVTPLYWDTVSAGGAFACAIRDDGSLWCWGRNNFGQLGLGDNSNRNTPHQVGDDNDWDTVAAGNDHTCATRDDGSLWCWGRNDVGLLGLGDTDERTTLHQVGSDSDWDTVTAGTTHTCAIRDDGSLWCWGYNLYGQLGLGGGSQRNTPHQVGDDNDWDIVAAGQSHSCATRDDDSLWCWGRNNYGQLGLGHRNNRNSPHQVGDDTDWDALSTGQFHTCATGDDGSLWCWGNGSDGRLGPGDTSRQTSPHQVGDDTDWDAPSAGSRHSCAIRDDNTLWCWGGGSFGRLGLGDDSNHWTPQQVGSDPDWTSLSDSILGAYTCAIRDDGSLWCWGNNSHGQLGLGDTDERNIPHQITTVSEP